MSQGNAFLATESVENMVALLKGVPGYSKNVFHVATEVELVDRTKSMTPVIGVLYEGMRAIPSSDADSSRGGGGTTVDLNISVMMFFRNEAMGLSDKKLKFISEVDMLRRSLLRQRAPGGHFWRFLVEAYVSGKDGKLAILQRWATTIQLV